MVAVVVVVVVVDSGVRCYLALTLIVTEPTIE